jgi:hypothetical protein
LGTLIWIVYELITQESLPPLSWVDAVFVGRYALVGLALWRYPAAWPGRRGLELGAVVLLVAVAAWFGVFQPALLATGRPWPYFLGVAIYPVFDAGLVYLAGRRFGTAGSPGWKRVTALLLGALAAYGAANWFNFSIRMASAGADSSWAALFWLLADVFAGAAGIYSLRQERECLVIE